MPKKLVTVEGITEYEFENGLRVLLFPDQSRSKVTVNMTVLVGSRHEGYGETGMAHLLEHMVFKGTPTHPNIPKALQEHGAQFNGSTSRDRTNYYETLTATDENLEFAIRLEADRLVNSRVSKDDLDSEMTVVRNEFEMGENSPLGVLSKRIAAVAYEWHNYGKTTIGNRSDIERVPIENLQAFYKKYYQPDNVVLIVAGRFQEAKALELIQKYFGAIPRPERRLADTYTEEPPQDGERTVTLRRVGNIGAVGMAYHIPAGSHEDSASLQVLADLLDIRPSGRLYRALVETKKAATVYASAQSEHDPGLMTIHATTSDVTLIDEIRETMLSIVEQIGTTGVSSEEVERAKQQILSGRALAAADTNRLAVSLSEWAAQGDWRLYFLNRDRIEQVTPATVQAVAARYLQRNNRTVGIFLPTEKAERVQIPTTPDVRELVASYRGRAAVSEGEAFDPSPVNIESRVKRERLPEGVQATLLPKKTRGEEVHLVLTLRYGDENSLKGMDTAATFLPNLMLRGTKQLSYQQIRDELNKLQATLRAGGPTTGRGRSSSSGGSLGSVTFSIQARRDTLLPVLAILRHVLREPTLPKDEFEVLKSERLASIEQMRSDPSTLASRQLQRQLAPYPKDDVRYTPTIEELAERTRELTHEQVVNLYREYLGSQAGELAIVGDFDPETTLPMLKEMLAGWNNQHSYARIASSAPERKDGSKERIHTPDKANATYLSGFLFRLRDDDPDYPALVLANYIFGGGSLSSRLGTRVRQQEGLSYGVGSSFSASSFDPRAQLVMNAISNPQNVTKVESAILEELNRLLKEGITDEELERAKQGYLQNQEVSRSSDGMLAALLAAASYAGRTFEFQAELEKRIRALTAEQVNAAVRKYIDAQKLVIVTAGDFEAK